MERTKHVKVWNSYARFADSRGDTAKARLVYGNADTSLKNTDLKEVRRDHTNTPFLGVVVE